MNPNSKITPSVARRSGDQNPKSTVVIPARYDSVRFPGKMLADRTGKPLIQHVYERAVQATKVERVIVATDDERIVRAVKSFGGEAVMTRRDHANGTSRSAEIAERLPAKMIVNVQGDEPDIDPSLIDAAIERLENDVECQVGTIASPFAPDENPVDPNLVKVVLDQRGRALYFSRALIPFERDLIAAPPQIPGTPAPGTGRQPTPFLKHVGLYVYRREFLSKYPALSPTPLEQTEKLEQLRMLEHGFAITVAVRAAHFHGIDTPEQYEEFVLRYGRQTQSA